MTYQYPFKDADDELKFKVWSLGKKILGKDSNIWRKDKYGTLIKYSEHGNTNSKNGWEIDHIKPKSKGGSDKDGNLQPLYWETNRKKGDIYPYIHNVKFIIDPKKLKRP